MVGDADFLNIRYVATRQRPRHTPSNITFMMNVLDWLGYEEDLVALRGKRYDADPD